MGNTVFNPERSKASNFSLEKGRLGDVLSGRKGNQKMRLEKYS